MEAATDRMAEAVDAVFDTTEGDTFYFLGATPYMYTNEIEKDFFASSASSAAWRPPRHTCPLN